MAHFGFLWMGKFMVDQEIFNPTWHLCAQDVTPSLTVQAEVQYVTNHLKVSKRDPFGQGVNMIIGCSGTQVCGACSAWDLIQSHWAKQATPTAPFFQLAGQPLSRGMMVGHMKGLLAKLRLNPSLYSGLCIHTGRAPMTATSSLRDWQIKSKVLEKYTYQTYIRKTTDGKINCARRMACTPASSTFNYQPTISS